MIGFLNGDGMIDIKRKQKAYSQYILEMRSCLDGVSYLMLVTSYNGILGFLLI